MDWKDMDDTAKMNHLISEGNKEGVVPCDEVCTRCPIGEYKNCGSGIAQKRASRWLKRQSTSTGQRGDVILGWQCPQCGCIVSKVSVIRLRGKFPCPDCNSPSEQGGMIIPEPDTLKLVFTETLVVPAEDYEALFRDLLGIIQERKNEPPRIREPILTTLD